MQRVKGSTRITAKSRQYQCTAVRPERAMLPDPSTWPPRSVFWGPFLFARPDPVPPPSGLSSTRPHGCVGPDCAITIRAALRSKQAEMMQYCARHAHGGVGVLPVEHVKIKASRQG